MINTITDALTAMLAESENVDPRYRFDTYTILFRHACNLEYSVFSYGIFDSRLIIRETRNNPIVLFADYETRFWLNEIGNRMLWEYSHVLGYYPFQLQPRPRIAAVAPSTADVSSSSSSSSSSSQQQQQPEVCPLLYVSIMVEDDMGVGGWELFLDGLAQQDYPRHCMMLSFVNVAGHSKFATYMHEVIKPRLLGRANSFNNNKPLFSSLYVDVDFYDAWELSRNDSSLVMNRTTSSASMNSTAAASSASSTATSTAENTTMGINSTQSQQQNTTTDDADDGDDNLNDDDDEASSINHYSMVKRFRSRAASAAKQANAHYLVYLDPVVVLQNKGSLRKLIYDNPAGLSTALINRPNSKWSTIWPGVDVEGNYRNTAEYVPLLLRQMPLDEHLADFSRVFPFETVVNIPCIRYLVIVPGEFFDLTQHAFSYDYQLHGYNPSESPETLFCNNMRHLDVFMHASTMDTYGYLLDEADLPLNYNINDDEDNVDGRNHFVDSMLSSSPESVF